MAGLSRISAALLLLAVSCVGVVAAADYVNGLPTDWCKKRGPALVPANSSTVIFGHYSLTKAPVSHVISGQTIKVEVLTHASTHFYSGMIKGDAGAESVFAWFKGQSVTQRTVPKLPGTGTHVVTGPIWVCGGEVGDVLKVQILNLVPRPNPNTGTTYGVNSLSAIGYHVTTAGKRNGSSFASDAQTQTVYEVKTDSTGSWGYPKFQFKSPMVNLPDGTTGFASSTGAITPHTYDFGPTGSLETYPPGFNVTLNSTSITYTDAALAFRIPLRPHLGIMGVTPANGLRWNANATTTVPGASTSPPSKFGGNIDDWRIGRGTTMYYQCELDGCKLALSDTHAAQGDSELSGTAIETSFTATIRIILIKKATLPLQIQNLNFPLGETAREYFIHGFAYNDYLSELGQPNTIGAVGNKMNSAFLNCYTKTRNFLMDAFTLTEEESIGIMSTSVDFIVTQVVDSNWGIHGIIKKSVFAQRTQGRKLLEYLQDANILEQMELRAKIAARKNRRSLLGFLGK